MKSSLTNLNFIMCSIWVINFKGWLCRFVLIIILLQFIKTKLCSLTLKPIFWKIIWKKSSRILCIWMFNVWKISTTSWTSVGKAIYLIFIKSRKVTHSSLTGEAKIFQSVYVKCIQMNFSMNFQIEHRIFVVLRLSWYCFLSVTFPNDMIHVLFFSYFLIHFSRWHEMIQLIQNDANIVFIIKRISYNPYKAHNTQWITYKCFLMHNRL